MIRTFLSAAVFLGFSGLTLHAQNSAPEKYELRLLAFTRDLQHKEAFAHDPLADENSESVATPIKGYLNHQFITVELKTRKIAFTTKSDHASLKRPGELIGEVTLPTKVKSAVLLFLPGNPEGNAKSQIMVIDDSKGSFPAGSFHITNLSPLPVRLALEKKLFEFAPGKTILIQDPPVRENRMSSMNTWALKDKQWKPIATSLWPHPGNSRSVKVLFQDPKSGRIQLRSFGDVPPRSPQQDTAAATASQ